MIPRLHRIFSLIHEVSVEFSCLLLFLCSHSLALGGIPAVISSAVPLLRKTQVNLMGLTLRNVKERVYSSFPSRCAECIVIMRHFLS